MSRRRRRTGWQKNPIVQARLSVAAGSGAVGVYWLAAARDTAMGWALIAFAAYSALDVSFEVYVQMVMDEHLSANAETVVTELVSGNQTVVLTLTGTTLGLLAAFSTGELQLTTKAAVVSLVAAALVQFTVQASGTRHLGERAWRLGLVGDMVAVWLFTFGLISLASSLVSRTGS